MEESTYSDRRYTCRYMYVQYQSCFMYTSAFLVMLYMYVFLVDIRCHVGQNSLYDCSLVIVCELTLANHTIMQVMPYYVSSLTDTSFLIVMWLLYPQKSSIFALSCPIHLTYVYADLM